MLIFSIIVQEVKNVELVLLRMNMLVISTHEFYNCRFLPGDHYCFAKIIKIDL